MKRPGKSTRSSSLEATVAVVVWLGAGGCLAATAGCDRIVPPALGTREGEPLLLGVERGSELQLGSLEASPLRVRLDTMTGESAYHSAWSLGSDLCLEVTPRSGAPVFIEGAPLSADYYHLGRVLFVTAGEEGQQRLWSFVEPITYRSITCPGRAAAATASPGAPPRAPAPTPARAADE